MIIVAFFSLLAMEWKDQQTPALMWKEAVIVSSDILEVIASRILKIIHLIWLYFFLN